MLNKYLKEAKSFLALKVINRVQRNLKNPELNKKDMIYCKTNKLIFSYLNSRNLYLA